VRHAQLKKTALRRPEVRAEYDELSTEFALLEQMLRARGSSGLSQAEVAERMGTHAPSVTRLESALASGRHSPTLETLKRYAAAVNCRLEISLVAVPGRRRTRAGT
jgi:transcriptional regulator with XRE-family HTH domain